MCICTFEKDYVHVVDGNLVHVLSRSLICAERGSKPHGQSTIHACLDTGKRVKFDLHAHDRSTWYADNDA